MNKTRIDWCGYSWNPVTGCLHGCPYCYAKKIAMRFDGHFDPTFHEERLDGPMKVKKPSRIFLGSMTDMFGDWVKREWWEKVAETIRKCPQHTFFVLTKTPQHISRFMDMLWPLNNLWLGVSVESQDFMWRISGLRTATAGYPNRLFVSFEPLLGTTGQDIMTSLIDIRWVIIGAQTNPERQPDPAWVDGIIAAAHYWHIPVFMKGNLKWPVKRQEMP